MPQKLSIKLKSKTGEPFRRDIFIIRSWHDAGGQVIYLHKNGTFGYKDGAPVRSLHDLNLLSSDPAALRQAKLWWDTVGKRISEQYYLEQDARLEELAQRSIGSPQAAEDNTSTDMVMYIRRPIKVRSRSAYCDPSVWGAFFDHRPDWWGSAHVIEIGGYRYEIVQSADGPGPEEDDRPNPVLEPAENTSPEGDDASDEGL